MWGIWIQIFFFQPGTHFDEIGALFMKKNNLFLGGSTPTPRLGLWTIRVKGGGEHRAGVLGFGSQKFFSTPELISMKFGALWSTPSKRQPYARE